VGIPGHTRKLAEQALSRAAGAPLHGGNAVEVLIDAPAHFAAWLAAIRGARHRVLLENYIVRDDAVGREFRDALAERAHAGVQVAVMVDWLGCLGQSRAAFWKPLRAAGGEVRVYNPLRLGEAFGWVHRDHRKLLVIDGNLGFVSGVCLSARWLGDERRGIAPWRDTGLLVRGPAVADLEAAFAQTWNACGDPLPAAANAAPADPAAGTVALRVIATLPASGGVYRLDQMVAALARKNLWITDAYFVGLQPYVQALVEAARDGVDVRMLVPGTSDIPLVASLSRSAYRPLLEAGIRVFEWNGSMLHAKTAVADGQWARIGSSNLNIASWLGNCEIDVAVEDAAIARQMAAQFQVDLDNATEIVLAPRARLRRARIRRSTPRTGQPHGAGGSAGRAAAGALRIVNTLGAAMRGERVLGRDPAGPALLLAVALFTFAVVAVLWPEWVAVPLATLATWFGLNLAISAWRDWRRPAPPTQRPADPPEQSLELPPSADER
jgi:cardiolipin synthase A/B